MFWKLILRLDCMEEFRKIVSAHCRLRLKFVFSLCVCRYMRTTLWSHVSHQMVGFPTKSSLAWYQELFCKVTLLASSRPERWTLNVPARFLYLYRATNLVKLQIGMRIAIGALIAKIVSSIAIVATSISSKERDIHRESHYLLSWIHPRPSRVYISLCKQE